MPFSPSLFLISLSGHWKSIPKFQPGIWDLSHGHPNFLPAPRLSMLPSGFPSGRLPRKLSGVAFCLLMNRQLPGHQRAFSSVGTSSVKNGKIHHMFLSFNYESQYGKISQGEYVIMMDNIQKLVLVKHFPNFCVRRAIFAIL